MKAPYQVENYRPVSKRRRLLIVLLAVATGVSLLGYMMGRRGDILRAGPVLPGDTARCKPGQTEGCVGGRAAVIVMPVVPAAAAASAPRP